MNFGGPPQAFRDQLPKVPARVLWPAATSPAMAPTVSFNGNFRVDAMLIKEIDRFDAGRLRLASQRGAHFSGDCQRRECHLD